MVVGIPIEPTGYVYKWKGKADREGAITDDSANVQQGEAKQLIQWREEEVGF